MLSKKIVIGTLTFALIGFVLYLLVILAGFLGCCAGVSEIGYKHILIIIGISGLLTFGICFYLNCFRKKQDKQ